MKKILLGLFFAMFAMQVNAASLTLSAVSSDGDSLSLNPSETTGQLVSGSAYTSTNPTFSHEWGIVANGSDTYVSFVVDGNAEPVDNISLFATDLLGNATGSALKFDDVADSVNIFTFTHLLVSNANYILKVVGAGSSSYSVTAETPIPAAVWLFGSALMGLFGVSRRKSTAVAA